VWETSTGKDVAELRGDAKSIESVGYAGFSPDGKFILTAGEGNAARIADASTGETLVELRGHDRRVYSAAFSPDGRFVVTTSMDDTARVWDVSAGRTLAVLRSTPVSADLSPYSSTFNMFAFAAFSPDGRYVVTSNVDHAPSVYLCEVCGAVADLLELVRGRVARDLTPEERRTHLHE
jgi:WD40 repeat protein